MAVIDLRGGGAQDALMRIMESLAQGKARRVAEEQARAEIAQRLAQARLFSSDATRNEFLQKMMEENYANDFGFEAQPSEPPTPSPMDEAAAAPGINPLAILGGLMGPQEPQRPPGQERNPFAGMAGPNGMRSIYDLANITGENPSADLAQLFAGGGEPTSAQRFEQRSETEREIAKIRETGRQPLPTEQINTEKTKQELNRARAAQAKVLAKVASRGGGMNSQDRATLERSAKTELGILLKEQERLGQTVADPRAPLAARERAKTRLDDELPGEIATAKSNYFAAVEDMFKGLRGADTGGEAGGTGGDAPPPDSGFTPSQWAGLTPAERAEALELLDDEGAAAE